MVDSTTAFDQSTLGCSFHCTSAGGIANVLPPAPCAPTGETAAMGVIAVASASTAAMMRLFQAPIKRPIRCFCLPCRDSANLAFESLVQKFFRILCGSNLFLISNYETNFAENVDCNNLTEPAKNWYCGEN